MAATSGAQYSVGMRFASVFALDANGYPSVASSGSGAPVSYSGLQAVGAKGFTFTLPEPRQVTHFGDDRVLQRDMLPPTEGSTAEFKVAKQNYTLLALLTGVSVSTIAENTGILYATDKQGSEPQVGLLFYQQSLDGTDGTRRWRGIWFPKAFCIPVPPGMDENPAEVIFRVTPMIVTEHLWGTAFATSPDGATQAQVIDRMYAGKPVLDTWKSDGTLSVVTLSQTATSVDKIAVFINGTPRTTNITKTTTDVTFTSALPIANDVICVQYEY